ncbi:MFS transporter [Oxalobacteraceae bacterium R-40]|uniref:MFS transporter n=1 Tax=Keguizhuia sedimenti TaxID=3064264 RepID=A0ABU1BS75_9BURK|nr:MFS transporter [Oxalobacteraceae bacterium R-40]
MKSSGLSFHHPVAFWIGCAALVAGVLAHIPMFIHSSYMDYQMAGMPMDTNMLIGMVLIPVGLLFAAYGLMPRLSQLAKNMGGAPLQFHVADSVPLNREHWKLVFVLIVALAVDVMKPATLGFVMPGVTEEYEISKETAGWLALVALTGTTVGSIVWGRLADAFGRRAAILLSALMFIGTAICGAMPTFEWNLAMCFLMGASAGGLLPITFTLMAEMIPAAHRGWLLVALGGIGTSAGYLIAAGSAAILEPMFSWRVLWLLGLPTGALIIFLDRYIPESPRFLANAGLEIEARAVLAKYSGVLASDANVVSAETETPQNDSKVSMLDLLRGPYASITYGLIACGIAWGLVNFGFLLWLPSNLGTMGMDAKAASTLIAKSAIFALPGILIVIGLYHRWSSVKTLVLFIALTTGALALFFVLALADIRSSSLIILATTCLLISASGVIAMLIPYAAEIYPVHLRGTGSGVIAASSKLGGILGAFAGVIGIFGNVAFSALLIAVPMIISALMLIRNGIDTRGRRLEEIEEALLAKFKQAAG